MVKEFGPDGGEVPEGPAAVGGLQVHDGVGHGDHGHDERYEEDGDEEGVGTGSSVELRRLAAVYAAVEVFDVKQKDEFDAGDGGQ